jgi:hypothetical protein
VVKLSVGRVGVKPMVAQSAVLSSGVKGPFYRPAWRVEALGGGRLVVEFNSIDFDE